MSESQMIDPDVIRILRLLADGGPVSVEGMARQLDMDDDEVRDHLQTLIEMGFVVKQEGTA